jgi:acetylornithine deacetylase/succinyl-diaminopimelate desuccinylase-like protein
MRLVPRQDPDVVFKLLATQLKQMETRGVILSAVKLSEATPVLTGHDHPGIVAARNAYMASFGAEPVLVREGATVPVTVDFQEALHPMLIVTGFGLPDDAVHSPNEKMSLDQYHRATAMVLHLMHELLPVG